MRQVHNAPGFHIIAEIFILLNVLSDYRLFKTPVFRDTCKPMTVGLQVLTFYPAWRTKAQWDSLDTCHFDVRLMVTRSLPR
jgi:hypothetical protein